MAAPCIFHKLIPPLFFLFSLLGAFPTAAENPATEKGKQKATVHILDGMKFKGPTGEKGKNTHHEDILRFDNGKFTSSECYQFGFVGGPYTATVQSGSIHFTAETVSPTHGKMNWKGTLTGKTLEVDYSWTKQRWLWTTYREYWFKGSLVE